MEMTLDQRIERSRDREAIPFSSIDCSRLDEPMVEVKNSAEIVVQPIWTLEDDIEGGIYRDYLATHPVYRGVYVRQTVLSHLAEAASLLPPGRRLLIRAGHRPLDVQQAVLRAFAAKFRAANPAATASEALRHARGFVSDPHIRRPPHCCGAAVDVEIFDEGLGTVADCGSPINLDAEISFLHSDIPGEVRRRNRMELLRVMLAAGFASNPAEWWHYSFGDEVWAWFYRRDASLYDIVELDAGLQS